MKKISVLILSLTLIIFFNTNVLAKCKGNCKNGFGKFEWDNGTIYEGNWKKGSFNGKGKTTYPDGGFYEGGFKNHNMHGHGKMAYANGDTSQGQLSNGVMNGLGKYMYPSRCIFKVQCINASSKGQ